MLDVQRASRAPGEQVRGPEGGVSAGARHLFLVVVACMPLSGNFYLGQDNSVVSFIAHKLHA